MSNPLSGHTAAQGFTGGSGLRDGDGLNSPSLTNPYEALHGNGILRVADGGYGGTRNATGSSTEGHVAVGAGGSITVSGGYAVLDGVVYQFAGGFGGSHTTTTIGTSTNYVGTLPTPHATIDKEAYVVIYVAASGTSNNIMYEFGALADPATETPQVPSTFLSAPGPAANQKSTVLAVLLYTVSAGGTLTASLNTPTVHDRRAFIRPTPMYLNHLTAGSAGSVTATNAIENTNEVRIDTIFSSPSDGDFNDSPFGGLWMTHSPDGHSVLLYSAQRDIGGTPTRDTWRLSPNEVKVISTGSDQSFNFTGPNIWVVTPSSAINLDPSDTFPHGHVIDVINKGSNNITFDSTGIAQVVAAGEGFRFVYTGSAWKEILVGSASPTTSSGASGLVQLSDGGGGFSSDSDLAWDSSTNQLSVSSNNVLTTASSVTDLSDVTAVGSGSIITSAERTKLSGIETSATADQTAAEIKTAYESNADTNAFTDADHTKLDNAMENLADDSTPQLGADLDVNGYKIVSDSGNENIVIHPHGSGQVVIGNQTETVNRLSSNGARQLKMEANSGIGASITLDSGTNGDIAIEPNGNGGVAVGTSTQDSNAILTVEGAISLDEISAPTNTADRGQLYTNSDNHLHFINGAGTDIKVTEEVFIVALSDEETDLTTGTGKASFHMPFAMTLTDVKATVNTAPTGATITVDINEGGTTILSTKLTIDASEKTSSTAATAAVISDSALANDAEITFDIDQVGSTVAGKGLKVTLYGYRA